MGLSLLRVSTRRVRPGATLGKGQSQREGLRTDADTPLASALYTGVVRHRRHAPHPHAFDYRLFLVYLDLSELDRVFRGRWLWSMERFNLACFRRSDYLGDPSIPLDQAVRDTVQQHTGARPAGPIRLLTHLRYFGHCFNPVSFYYCFDEDGRTLQTIVAEITNTPWNQRHSYVLDASDSEPVGGMRGWRFGKRFHVSPFMAMEHAYAWRFDTPGPSLRVHMDVLPPNAAPGDLAGRQMDVTLTLQRRPINPAGLARALLRYPLMTVQVVLAIHWHALRLWLKRNPVYDHPDSKAPSP